MMYIKRTAVIFMSMMIALNFFSCMIYAEGETEGLIDESLQNVNNEVLEGQGELEEAVDTLKVAEENLIQANADYESAKVAKDEAEKTLEDLGEQLKLSEDEEANKAAEVEVAELTEKSEVLEDECADLYNEINQKSQEFNSVEELLNDANESLTDLTEKGEDLGDEIVNLREDIEDKSETVNELEESKERLMVAQKEYDAVKAEADIKAEEVEKLQNTLEDSAAKLEQVNEEMIEANNELTDVKLELAKNEKRQEELRLELEKAQKASELGDDYHACLDKLESLKAEQECIIKSIEESNNKINKLNALIEEKNESIEKLSVSKAAQELVLESSINDRDEALSVLEDLNKEKSEYETMYDEAVSEKELASSKLSDMQNEILNGVNNLNSLEDILNNRRSDLLIAKEVISNGSYGFFESIGTSKKVFDYIGEIRDYVENHENYILPDVGNDDSSTNLENVARAIETIIAINDIRENEGLDRLQINDLMMLVAEMQTDASASMENLRHSQLAPVGENLACGGSMSLQISSWYDGEKAVYNYVKDVLGVEEKKINQSYVTSLSDDIKAQIVEACNLYSADFVQVGHYLNIVKPSYKMTGAGYNNNHGTTGQTFGDGNSDYCMVNEDGNMFNRTEENRSTKMYDDKQFYELFKNYYKKVSNDVIKAAEALEKAQSEYDVAKINLNNLKAQYEGMLKEYKQANYDGQLSFCQNRIGDLEKQIRVAEDALADKQDAVNKAEDRVNEIQDEIYNMDESVQLIRDELLTETINNGQLNVQTVEINRDIENVRKEADELMFVIEDGESADCVDKLDEVNRRVESLNASAERLTLKLEELNEEAKDKQNKYETVSTSLKEAYSILEEICDILLKKSEALNNAKDNAMNLLSLDTEDMDVLMESLNNEISIINEELVLKNAKLEELEAELEDNSIKLVQCETELANANAVYTNLSLELAKLEAEYSATQSDYAQAAANLNAAKENAKKHSAEYITNLYRKHAEANEVLMSVRDDYYEKLKQKELKEEELKKIKEDYKNQEIVCSEKTVQYNEILTEYEDSKTQLENIVVNIVDMKDADETLDGLIKVYEEVEDTVEKYTVNEVEEITYSPMVSAITAVLAGSIVVILLMLKKYCFK